MSNVSVLIVYYQLSRDRAWTGGVPSCFLDTFTAPRCLSSSSNCGDSSWLRDTMLLKVGKNRCYNYKYPRRNAFLILHLDTVASRPPRWSFAPCVGGLRRLHARGSLWLHYRTCTFQIFVFSAFFKSRSTFCMLKMFFSFPKEKLTRSSI